MFTNETGYTNRAVPVANQPVSVVYTELDKQLEQLQNENMISRDPHVLARVKEVLEGAFYPKATPAQVTAAVKAQQKAAIDVVEAAKVPAKVPDSSPAPAPVKTAINPPPVPPVPPIGKI